MRKTNYPIIFSLLFIITLTSFPSLPEAGKPSDLYSEAAVVIDARTGEVLYEKNAYRTMYPASITKIITTIVALEEAGLSDDVQVSFDAVNVIGSRVYLLEEEILPLEQLLLGIMISSGNDASIAVAEHIDGSVEAFADRMNAFVREKVGVENSNFTNPHGLFEEEHVTTAYDMARISAYAMGNEQFREIVGTKSLDWKGEGWETTLYNHHDLMRQNDHITGVKNGYVRRSGYTLVTSAFDGDTEVIVVTLNTPSRLFAYNDTNKLIDYSLAEYETQVLSLSGEDLLTNHIIPEELAVTTRRGEDVKYEVREEGEIIVTGKGNRKIAHIDLEKRYLTDLPSYIIPSDKETTVVKKQEEPIKKSIALWFILSGFNKVFNR
ncbi:D-alanyl-D-alanine carboxypeptidase [Bacillus sp. H-16]|uniref:D-alanyl-D-alanine carboxypeptidase family protein n=1 Tax=Alteribacter salitolerans TaxID=2912333 RepID=UPI0019622DC8|nr:D-alanyl-D-alanine carboxypeptidase family protein [Alteribacter salitolerans]MBM7094541.1 D-alanyl-D-alanine carboxypeptidase [Alteribacter salitolerans]